MHTSLFPGHNTSLYAWQGGTIAVAFGNHSSPLDFSGDWSPMATIHRSIFPLAPVHRPSLTAIWWQSRDKSDRYYEQQPYHRSIIMTQSGRLISASARKRRHKADSPVSLRQSGFHLWRQPLWQQYYQSASFGRYAEYEPYFRLPDGNNTRSGRKQRACQGGYRFFHGQNGQTGHYREPLRDNMAFWSLHPVQQQLGKHSISSAMHPETRRSPWPTRVEKSMRESICMNCPAAMLWKTPRNGT